MALTPGFRISWTANVGELVAIEPTLTDVAAHAAELAAGYNQPDNARHMGHTEAFTEQDVVEHYASMHEGGARTFLLFLEGRLVGDADLRGLRDGAAEFAFMIGAPGLQGKGLGTRFALMLHACAFAQLGLDRVYASIAPTNRASRRVFEKLGYTFDDSTEARGFADEPDDVTMVIGRAIFEHTNALILPQLRIELVGEPPRPKA